MTGRLWRLEDFQRRLQEWVEREHPPTEWIGIVGDWIGSRAVAPRVGATRVLELGTDVWFSKIDGAGDDQRNAVCFFSVNDDAGAVRCTAFATLTHPIVT